MQLAVFSANKFAHLAVVRHGRLLSLPAGAKITDILSLSQSDRDYMDGQSGKHLNAPLGTYPLLSPIVGGDSSDLLDAASRDEAPVYGPHSAIELPSGSPISGKANVAPLTLGGELVGYCLELALFAGQSSSPFARAYGPWITTVSELSGFKSDSGHTFALTAMVNGKESDLSQLHAGDTLSVQAEGLGLLENTLSRS
jgi:hypothetical protein